MSSEPGDISSASGAKPASPLQTFLQQARPSRELLKRLRSVLLSELEGEDNTHNHVPVSRRRNRLTMGLLWITMVTSFPCVLVGFTWYRDGLTLSQVAGGLLTSCLILLVYSIPACYLGSKTGLTYGLLSRFVFGRWGSRFVSFNSIWVSVGWYALNAIFLAEGLRGIFNIAVPHALFVALIAVLMSGNNFFGFTGVSNFARYVAAPVLVLWVATTFFKAQQTLPANLWNAPPATPDTMSLTAISAFVLGIACWGNEADFWRYGKPSWKQPVAPLLISLSVGQILFPITGWMLARLTGVTDYAGATRLMNSYVFDGLSLVSAAVLIITYVAVNDAGLYAAINASENLRKIPRKLCVGILAASGAAGSVLLLDYKHNFEAVASLSCIFLPCATVVMIAEFFLAAPLLKARPIDYSRIPSFDELPAWRPPALIALVLGCLYGTAMSGFIPGGPTGRTGIPALEAWLISLVTYLVLRRAELAGAAGKKDYQNNVGSRS